MVLNNAFAIEHKFEGKDFVMQVLRSEGSKFILIGYYDDKVSVRSMNQELNPYASFSFCENTIF